MSQNPSTVEKVCAFPAQKLDNFVDFLKRLWDIIKVLVNYFWKGLR